MGDTPETIGEVVASQAAGAEPSATTKRAARNAAFTAAAEIAGKVATLAYTVAAARVLHASGYGAFAYAVSFSLLIGTIPSWGFDPILIQGGSADRKHLPRYLSEVLVWRTLAGIPVFVGAGIAGFALRPSGGSGLAFVLIMAAALLDLYGDAGRAAAAAAQSQFGVSKALVLQRVVTAALAVGALAEGFGLVGLAVAYLGGSLLGLVAVAFALRRLGVGLDLGSVRREGLLRMGRLSLAIGIDTVLSLALFRVDQVILGALKGNQAVGFYAAGYRLLETVLFVTWAVNRAVFPIMATATDRARIRRASERALGAIALVFVPFGVGLWMEARPLLLLLFGPSYAGHAVGVVRWLAPAPFLFAVGYVGSYALLARNRRWPIVGVTVACVVYNIVANLLLIPSLSGTGAALVTTTSYAIQTVLTLWLCAREFGWIRMDRVLALPAVAAGIMAGILALVPGGVLIEAPLGAVLYSVAWLLLARALAPDQVAVVRSIVQWRR